MLSGKIYLESTISKKFVAQPQSGESDHEIMMKYFSKA
jgi:hypothetical protein